MRRITSSLAVAAITAVTIVASATPALADVDFDDGDVDLDDGIGLISVGGFGFGGLDLDDGDIDFGDVDGVGQEFELDDVESGDVEPEVDISSSGDNVNLSPAVLQNTNSGNVQNVQGVTLFDSDVDDIEFEGSSIGLGSELEFDSDQTTRQAAAVR